MHRFIVLLLLCCSGLLSAAQSPEYRSITDQNGLPCNEVYNLCFDSTGYLWLGTETGLYRFDGTGFKAFQQTQGQGNALIGTTMVGGQFFVNDFLGNFFYVRGDSLIHTPIPRSFHRRGIISIKGGLDGKLYLGLSEGLYTYEPVTGEWTDITPEGMRDSSRRAGFRVVASDGRHVWVCAPSGILRIGAEGYRQYRIRNGAGIMHSAYIEGNGNEVWLCSALTGNAVFRIRGNKEPEPYRNAGLQKLLEGKKHTRMRVIGGKLYFLSFSGIVIHDVASGESEWVMRGIPVTDISPDPEGQYWISTLGHGLLYCPSLDYRTWGRTHPGELNNKYNYFAPAPDGGLYVSRYTGGLGWIDPEGKHFEEIPVPRQMDITAFRAMENGQVVLALNNELYEVKGRQVVLMSADGPATKDLLFLDGGYYVASSVGLYFHEVSKAGQIAPANVAKHLNEIWCRRLCRQGSSDTLWVGTTSGLIGYYRKQPIDTLLPDKVIRDLLWVEEEQTLYCASLSGEIYSVREGRSSLFKTVSSEDRQIHRLRWREGKLWIATSKGIGIIQTTDLVETWFNSLDGLSSNIVYDLHFHAGYWWLATGNGLQRIPANPVKSSARPVLFLQDIRINGLARDGSGVIRLATDDELELRFNVMSYYSRGEYQIAYRLGSDKWFHLPPGQNELILSAPGQDIKELQVKVTDAKNQESETMFFALEVLPPYWRRLWFVIVLILGASSMVALGYGSRLKKVKKRQQDVLEREKLRSNLIESQLTALKAQMNPHFIFNALNSIYELILLSESREAATYLNKFAVLLRKVLENSEKESIPFKEECEWLELYLELEKLRFGEDFTYEIDTREVKNPYDYSLPTMLLQPFVENSVKHGLLHKPGIKRLEIHFSQVGENLRCQITDNGIGREAAEKHRKLRSRNHRSFATSAVQRRIAMLNESGRFRIELGIEDLYFPDGKPAGTQVNLLVRNW